MHRYLRAIGLTEEFGRQNIRRLIAKTIETPSGRAYTTRSDKDDTLIAEFLLEVSEGAGICVCGEFDESDAFHFEYYLPYFRNNRVSSREEVTVERRVDTESFEGACDDLKVGVTIIFRVLNIADYVKHDYGRGDIAQGALLSLTALSTEGTVMFPIQKSENDRASLRKDANRRMQWLTEARNGDENAMRNLTLEDMDHYNVLWDQIQHEDVFSLVDNYFMPVGTECDLYSVLGEIVSMRTLTNYFSGETMYVLTVDVNDLVFDVCINTKDLYGEPDVGRRFKGIIWMQGTLLYPDS